MLTVQNFCVQCQCTLCTLVLVLFVTHQATESKAASSHISFDSFSVIILSFRICYHLVFVVDVIEAVNNINPCVCVLVYDVKHTLLLVYSTVKLLQLMLIQIWLEVLSWRWSLRVRALCFVLQKRTVKMLHSLSAMSYQSKFIVLNTTVSSYLPVYLLMTRLVCRV